jgi:acetylornithine deacetylase/succinyl-diaminopimelate desuccinylase family protein
VSPGQTTRTDETIRLLADLVAIPSMNPMGRDRTGPHYREEAIAAYVAGYIRSRGIDAEVSEVSPGRPNVTATLDAGREQTLLLEAHLDTVHADTMEIPPFDPVVRDGNLFGRGACDTKASLAVFIRALCAFAESGQRPRYNILLAAVADEEYRFTGAKHLAAKGLRADFGIAGEPTRLQIVRAHKGVTRWRILTEGKAAHSAYPERGANAIYRMGHVLERLESYANGLQKLTPHPVLGTPTLSVGVIEGGQAVNIVPDRCTIEIDRRTLPGESAASVMAPVREVLRGIDSWRFEEPHLSVQGMDVGQSSEIATILSEGIRAVTGDVQIVSAQYATDAGVYNQAGVPTVVFGPGDIARAHTSNEYVELSQVIQADSIIRAILA